LNHGTSCCATIIVGISIQVRLVVVRVQRTEGKWIDARPPCFMALHPGVLQQINVSISLVTRLIHVTVLRLLSPAWAVLPMISHDQLTNDILTGGSHLNETKQELVTPVNGSRSHPADLPAHHISRKPPYRVADVIKYMLLGQLLPASALSPLRPLISVCRLSIVECISLHITHLACRLSRYFAST